MTEREISLIREWCFQGPLTCKTSDWPLTPSLIGQSQPRTNLIGCQENDQSMAGPTHGDLLEPDIELLQVFRSSPHRLHSNLDPQLPNNEDDKTIQRGKMLDQTLPLLSPNRAYISSN